MSERDATSFLFEIRHAVARIKAFTAGLEREAYGRDDLVRDAVERNLITVGEAVASLRRDFSAVAAQLPDAAQIVAMRNILVHAYTTIDNDVVWRVLTQHLAPLSEAVDAMIGD